VLQQAALKIQVLRLDGYKRQKQKLTNISKATLSKAMSGKLTTQSALEANVN